MPSKTQKFNEVHKMPNVLERDFDNIKKELKKYLKQWPKIILELGCGNGDYTVSLAKQNPKILFIGIDIQGERIWHGAKIAIKNKQDNVLFVRDYIDNLLSFIPQQSISEIWITFPDPFPKKRQAKKRLTAPKFLEIYQTILKPQGPINLKTDSLPLFKYSKESITKFGGNILSAIKNIHQKKKIPSELEILTCFEKKHISKNRKIYYLKAQL